MKGHIRRRGDRTWAVVIDIGLDEHGKRRQRWHTVHGNKRDAEARLGELLGQIHGQTYAEPSRTTVAQWVKEWLEGCRVRVRPLTLESYTAIARRHILPALGGVRLDRLTPRHIDRWCQELRMKPRAYGRGGCLSPRTVEYAHAVLSRALIRAVELEIISRNPAAKVRPTAPPPLPPEVDQGAATRLLEASEGTRLHLPILLALTTGMRRGEILGLRWQDVDLERGAAQIRQTVLPQKTSPGWMIGEPKTSTGRRTVLLPAMAVAALRQHRRNQLEWRIRTGGEYTDHGLVISTASGSPWPPSSFGRAYRALTTKAGIDLTFHALRHVHATMLLGRGIHPWIVAARLGHRDTATTKLYSHARPAMQEEAAAAIDEELGLQDVCKPGAATAEGGSGKPRKP